MSRLYKSSRIVLDDKAFVLSTKLPEVVSHIEHEDVAVSEGISPSETANLIIEAAKNEAAQILEEADEDAKQKLDLAQNSADAIVSDAYDQAKGIMEQAKVEGYQEGYNRGVEDSQEIAKQIVDEALAIKNDWIAMRESVLRESENEMIALVIEAIEKVVENRVETDTSLIESLIKQGINRVTKSHLVSIRVSNEDYNHALSIKPMIIASSDKIEDLEIKRDPTLTNGSCIIDTDSGSIDSSIKTQVEQIKSLFLELLKGE